MTSYGAMSAAGLRVLDLLTVSEAAVRQDAGAKGAV